MYPLSSKGTLCGLFGVSRQAWYDSKKRKATSEMEEVFILRQVKELRKDHKRMGVEKLYHLIKTDLEAHNIKFGRDKLYALLRAHGLTVKRRRSGARTTNSNHLYRKYPNLIRDKVLNTSNQLWVSDITYLRTAKGFVYLSLVTDAYSKKIVGWSLWPELSSTGPLNAIGMAVEIEGVKPGLTHHSDRGIQYCCYDYVNFLDAAKIGISMTENGDPYENAVAERVNGILKDEYELDEVFADYHLAMEATKVAVDKYNKKRPHLSIDYLVPVEAHKQSGVLKKHWKKRVFEPKKKAVINTAPVKENSEIDSKKS